MTRDEVLLGLECHKGDGKCYECPFFNSPGSCTEKLYTAAVNLLNEMPDEQINNGNDAVNHPKHYNREGAMEYLEEFVAIYGVPAGIIACLFNIGKYRYRAMDKNGLEDMKKSDDYVRKLIELKQRKEDKK